MHQNGHVASQLTLHIMYNPGLGASITLIYWSETNSTYLISQILQIISLQNWQIFSSDSTKLSRVKMIFWPHEWFTSSSYCAAIRSSSRAQDELGEYCRRWNLEIMIICSSTVPGPFCHVSQKLPCSGWRYEAAMWNCATQFMIAEARRVSQESSDL